MLSLKIMLVEKCVNMTKCREEWVNLLRPRQNGRHFTDVFKCIFLNENIQISIKISLQFVPNGPINNIPTLVRIMAWCRPDGKPSSGPMMVSLLWHICVTRPQWVNVTWWMFSSLSLCSSVLWFCGQKWIHLRNNWFIKMCHMYLQINNLIIIAHVYHCSPDNDNGFTHYHTVI